MLKRWDGNLENTLSFFCLSSLTSANETLHEPVGYGSCVLEIQVDSVHLGHMV